MENPKKDLIFLSYANEDVEKVTKIYDGLLKRGLNVWFAPVHLVPGPIKPQFSKAIVKSRYFILCLSTAALQKIDNFGSYLFDEFNEVYNITKNLPSFSLPIVPVRIENCGRGDHRIDPYTQFDIFPEEKFEYKLDELAVKIGGQPIFNLNLVDNRSIDERRFDDFLNNAKSFLIARDIEKAKNSVNDALKLNSENSEALHLLACIYESVNNLESAIGFYSRAIEFAPNNAMAYNNRGYAYQKLGKFDEALKDYNESIRINPNEAVPYFNRGDIYLRQILKKKTGEYKKEKFNQVFENLSKAIELDPTFSSAYRSRGCLYYMLNDSVKAIEDLSEAININPNDAKAFKLRGEVNFAREEILDAIHDYTEAIRISRDYRDAYFKRALCYDDINKLDLAVADYTRAIEIEPRVGAYINRANLNRQIGKYEEAYSDLDNALQLDPNAQDAKDLLENWRAFDEAMELRKGTSFEKAFKKKS